MSHIKDVLLELDYPTDRETAVETFEETTLLLAGGEINLGEALSGVPSSRFDSMSDLEAELHLTLPREAVGEPYQSEGDG